MLDARTAVALARTSEADLRFFLKPPYFYEEHKFYVSSFFLEYIRVKCLNIFYFDNRMSLKNFMNFSQN